MHKACRAAVQSVLILLVSNFDHTQKERISPQSALGSLFEPYQANDIVAGHMR